jgi:hypothetical protein
LKGGTSVDSNSRSLFEERVHAQSSALSRRRKLSSLRGRRKERNSTKNHSLALLLSSFANRFVKPCRMYNRERKQSILLIKSNLFRNSSYRFFEMSTVTRMNLLLDRSTPLI